MSEKYVRCQVFPRVLEAFPDCWERVGKLSRDALARGGAVCELGGHDLTKWELKYVAEYFDPDLWRTVREHFDVVAIAPMPDAVEVVT